MSNPKNQHYIPKVYLKYFSKLNDGKNISVLDKGNPYRKYIQTVDSGNAIFWEKNYYNSQAFDDQFIIERIFAQEFEPNYNKLIKEISKNQFIIDNDIKMDLLRWIMFGKFRSPVIREHFKAFYSISSKTSNEINKLAKAAHLELFANSEFLSSLLNKILPGFLSMKWEIISTNYQFPFLTGDSPGFTVNIDFVSLNNLSPKPFWEILNVNDVQFFPLTKEYALEISAYDKGTELSQNFLNTPINKRKVDEGYVNLINVWTALTSTIIISSRKDLLEPFIDSFN